MNKSNQRKDTISNPDQPIRMSGSTSNAQERFDQNRSKDDSFTSGKKRATTSSKDKIDSEWKLRVNAAKSKWNKLTEDELLKSQGRIEELASLVQNRYMITYDEAEKQVKTFLGEYAVY